ncbi:acyltransferase family protein [Succinivibrio dextrinosolvens]|uniref:acyltransferase family protein n=1 Tax=Succinivibrio dextrinosolvens TaxID=83771 RepID=UPI0039C5FF93
MLTRCIQVTRRFRNVIFISEPVIYGLAFFLLMFSLRMQPVFIFNNKILRFLGKYSYPIYLLHFLMIYLINCSNPMNILFYLDYALF